MRVLAAIRDPAVARRILVSMSLPARAPPLAAARPEALRSEAHAGEVAAAGDDFDQTPPWERGLTESAVAQLISVSAFSHNLSQKPTFASSPGSARRT